MPKKELKAPMVPPDLEAYYDDPEILAPPSRKALVKNTRKELMDGEYDEKGCA